MTTSRRETQRLGLEALEDRICPGLDPAFQVNVTAYIRSVLTRPGPAPDRGDAARILVRKQLALIVGTTPAPPAVKVVKPPSPQPRVNERAQPVPPPPGKMKREVSIPAADELFDELFMEDEEVDEQQEK